MALRRRNNPSRGFSLVELMISTVILVFLVAIIVVVTISTFKVWQSSSARSNGYLATQAALTMLNHDVRNAAYIMTPPLWSASASYAIGANVQDNANNLTYTCTIANGPTANSPSNNLTQWTLSAPWVIIYRPMLESQMPVPDTYITNTLQVKVNHTPLLPDYSYVTEYYVSNSAGAEGTLGSNLYVRHFSEAIDGSGNATIIDQETHPLLSNVTKLTFSYTTNSGAGVLQQYAFESIAVTTVGTQGLQTSTSIINSRIAIRNSMAITFTPPPRPVFH